MHRLSHTSAFQLTLCASGILYFQTRLRGFLLSCVNGTTSPHELHPVQVFVLLLRHGPPRRRLLLADEMLQVSAEVLVHERIDDRVGDVVGEVQVEDGHVPRQPVERHQEPWREGGDEDHSHDEQHRCRAQVGQESALRLTANFRLRRSDNG